MVYQIDHIGRHSYVSRPPNQADIIRYIRNGYEPPELVSERDATIYQYLRCEVPANYPVPAIRQRTFESLRKLGYSSAENKFPIDVVFENYIKL